MSTSNSIFLTIIISSEVFNILSNNNLDIFSFLGYVDLFFLKSVQYVVQNLNLPSSCQ